MDYEDIIKLEEQSPIYSTGNNSQSRKQCMVSFYDNDSQNDQRQPHEQFSHTEQLSFDKAIDFIQNYVDLIDTPLEDILSYFDRLDCTQGLDRNVLRKKILKRKNLLKRYRAKNRQPRTVYAYQQLSPIISSNAVDTQAEIKKKRNRVSAQISRDRKKQYFKTLEQTNEKLEEEIIRTKLENQMLRKQIEQSEMPPKSRVFSDSLNNKLTKLLIFLGIIFLIGMLKETFFSASDSLSKLKTFQKVDEFSQFSSFQQEKLIEQSQRKVIQFLDQPELEEELNDNEERKVSSDHLDIIDLTQNRKRSKSNIVSGLISRLNDMKRSIYG